MGQARKCVFALSAWAVNPAANMASFIVIWEALPPHHAPPSDLLQLSQDIKCCVVPSDFCLPA